MRRYLTLILHLCLLASPAYAIITLGGEGRLAAPPPDAYKESGIQYTGTWGGFVGTTIGPHHFITAGHVGGGVGSTFIFHGRSYPAEGVTWVKGTDLAVWRVKGRFPQWAQLYDKNDESGREIVLYGRGCRRGRPFRLDSAPRGWLWGDDDGSLSWGRNRVEGVAPISGGAEMLIFGFDSDGGDEEGTVARGDSGGGVFIQDGTTWKLAGVIHASGGQYSRTVTGMQPFMAALYDARSLYQNTDSGWVQHDPAATGSAPTLAFATRISSNASAIRAINRIPASIEPARSPSRYLLFAAVLAIPALILISMRRKRHRLRTDKSW